MARQVGSWRAACATPKSEPYLDRFAMPLGQALAEGVGVQKKGWHCLAAPTPARWLAGRLGRRLLVGRLIRVLVFSGQTAGSFVLGDVAHRPVECGVRAVSRRGLHGMNHALVDCPGCLVRCFTAGDRSAFLSAYGFKVCAFRHCCLGGGLVLHERHAREGLFLGEFKPRVSDGLAPCFCIIIFHNIFIFMFFIKLVSRLGRG